MSIDQIISALMSYAETQLELPKRDTMYALNSLLGLLDIESVEIVPTQNTHERLDTLLEELVTYALHEGKIEEWEQEKFCDRVMGILSLRPSEIQTRFEENYAKNLTLDSVSDFLGISKSSINRICNRMKGKSFSAYLTEVRMKNARQMFYNPTNNIKTIALLCGYNSYDSFYHAFVKYYGYPPSKNTIKRTKSWPFESSKFDLYKEYE